MAASDHKCPRCDKFYSFSRENTSTCSHCGHEITPDDSKDEAPRIAPNPKSLRLARWLLLFGLFGFSGSMFFSQFSMIVFGGVGFAGLILHLSLPHRCGNCGGEILARVRFCRHCGANFGFTVR